MNRPKVSIHISLNPDGAPAISTEYSPELTAAEAELLKRAFEEHVVPRVNLELENLFQ